MAVVTRTISDLTPADATSWTEIQQAVASAPYPIDVLTADPERADRVLLGLEVTTRSWLGAVAYHTGGILIDHGWLRAFGAGDPDRSVPDILQVNGPSPRGCIVGEDILGGRFLWIPKGDGERPTVHYYGGDTMEWADLEVGYAEWLGAMLGGAITEFYQHLRWPGWEREVTALRGDQGISTFPFLGTKEGSDLSQVSRRPVQMTELISLYGSALS